MKRAALAFFAILALACSAGAATAGVQLTPVRSTFPERSFVLTLPKGAALGAGAVSVTENGQPVADIAVTPVGARGQGIGTVLVVDTSNSMRGKPLADAFAAARAFAARRNGNQRLAVVTFDRQARVRLPFTTNARKIDRALLTLPRTAEGTHIYDALAVSYDLIRSSRVRAASIVVLSDGADTGSRISSTRVVGQARRDHIRLFTVGLASPQFSPAALMELATRSGASYSEATSSTSLAAIFDQLGYRLANEYLLQYKSFARPNEHVEVRVTLTGGGGSAATTYVSPKLNVPSAEPTALHRSAIDRILQSPLTAIVIGALAAVLLGVTAAALIQPRQSGVRSRIGAFVSIATRGDAKRQTSAVTDAILSGTERSLQRTRWWGRFKDDLEIGEIALPAEQVVVLTLLGTLFAIWLLAVLAAAPFGIFGLGIPVVVRLFVKNRADRQRRRFGDQLPDNLQVLSSALRAGHSLVGALSVVVDDAPEPSQREFRRVVADEQLGIPLEDALTRVAERMGSRDLEQVSLVAALQRETGGNSSEVLDRVADTVRERAALRRLVRTLTAQGRMARWIVSGLPIFLLLFISIVNSEYMKPLFSRTLGQVMVVFAALMVIAGSLVIRRIINIKV